MYVCKLTLISTKHLKMDIRSQVQPQQCPQNIYTVQVLFYSPIFLFFPSDCHPYCNKKKKKESLFVKKLLKIPFNRLRYLKKTHSFLCPIFSPWLLPYFSLQILCIIHIAVSYTH